MGLGHLLGFPLLTVSATQECTSGYLLFATNINYEVL